MKQAVSKEEFARRIQEQTLPEILNRVEVTAGELYFIPSGTLHAIGAGILLAEIQQKFPTPPTVSTTTADVERTAASPAAH